jgi:penicillin-binding protein 2
MSFLSPIRRAGRSAAILIFVLQCCAPFASAQVALKAQPVEEATPNAVPEAPKPPERKDLNASWQTQREARTLTLAVPAPRGQIVDRNGVPFAQNRVVNYLSLNFPHMADATPQKILEFAHGRMSNANRLLGKTWSVPDDKLLSHYEHRRWLPLVFSEENGLKIELSADELEKIKPLLGNGLQIMPAYMRHYPKEKSACHIIGYTGKTRPLPTGPIQDGDPLFEEMEGREGLEITFDKDLQGQPGMINVLFSPDGTRLSEEILRKPVPGANVITTLDYNMQKYAENALQKFTRSGAMVIMNVTSGDILAMASNPMYDLNQFVPGVKADLYKKLQEDPMEPMLARSFRGQYPPASTFKAVSALAALDSGAVSTKTYFECDNGMYIGKIFMKNWNKEGEGSMNVITAIKRSCNTWFYQAGIETGGDALTGMALRLGFGEKSGIPLKAEAAGFVPTNAWMLQRFNHKLMHGDLANIAIGQGRVLATPLQVCQSMAAIADGVNMPQARLVKQVQDLNDRVVQAYPIQTRKRVELKPECREAVVKGMIAVVSGSGGTGASAGIEHAQVAGKTGTAQWKIETRESEFRNLAWFSGFVPAQNPVYAFAVVYEGAPGEDVSGGKKAAPIVRQVFNNIYENAAPDDPLLLASKDVPKAEVVDEDSEGAPDNDTPRATPVEETAPPPPPAQDEGKGFKGFFKKLFNR